MGNSRSTMRPQKASSELRQSPNGQDSVLIPPTTEADKMTSAERPESTNAMHNEDTMRTPKTLSPDEIEILAARLLEAARSPIPTSTRGNTPLENGAHSDSDAIPQLNIANDREGLAYLCAAAETVEADAAAEANVDGDEDEEDEENEANEEKEEDEGDNKTGFRFVVGRFFKDNNGKTIDQMDCLPIECIDKNHKPRTHLQKAPQNWDDPKEIEKLNRNRCQWLRRATGEVQKKVQVWEEDEKQHLKSLIQGKNNTTVEDAVDSLNQFNHGKTWLSKGVHRAREERSLASVSSEWIRLRRELENEKNKDKSTAKVSEEEGEVTEEEDSSTDGEASVAVDDDELPSQISTRYNLRTRKRKGDDMDEEDVEDLTPVLKKRK